LTKPFSSDIYFKSWQQNLTVTKVYELPIKSAGEVL